MEFKAKRKKDIHLDITPIVDTVFNLMLFFALSLNFAASPASLLLKLPEVDSRSYPLEAGMPEIAVSESGDILVNRRAIPLDDLQRHLLALRETYLSDRIIIQADMRVDHGTVVTIMDICQTSGFRAISIAVHPKK